MLLTEGYSYSGAKGDIKVWTPYVESNDDYSTSFVSLRSGAHLDYEEVESGWAVSTYKYYPLQFLHQSTYIQES